jgi:hypothetical protein
MGRRASFRARCTFQVGFSIQSLTLHLLFSKDWHKESSNRYSCLLDQCNRDQLPETPQVKENGTV